jgi:alcohol dehydrogenase
MQLGAHYAGQAIEMSMLGAAHALANPLTAHYGIVHGLAVSLMLPHVIRFNAQL